MKTLAPLLLTCLFVLPAYAKYSGGTGEPNDPYQIATAADLIALGESPEDYDKHFILTADIDLDPNLPGRKVFDKAVIAPAFLINTYPYLQGISFTGVFDGNAHKISHLTIMGKDYVGYVGQLASAAEVKNLGLVDVDIGSPGGPVGGLVGRSEGLVTHCFSAGVISGSSSVGGLVGWNDGTITDCYAACSVRGDSDVGGLAGTNGHRTQYPGAHPGLISNCYSTSAVRGAASAGGLLGANKAGDVVDCFWDTQTSGQASSAAGLGLTTAQMQDVQTYLLARWDFVGEMVNGTREVWQMPEGGGYPVLAILNGYTRPELEGLGTSANPFLISDALDLGAICYYPHKHYRLTADIDLAGICWKAGVIPLLTGTFDGHGHTISHLTIEPMETIWRYEGGTGLFGQLVTGAEVRNLGVVDVNIAGAGHCVGALVATNGGVVAYCHSTGTISSVVEAGGAVIGGLVGSNAGDVIGCYTSAVVNGIGNVGGLVGSNEGSVAQCHGAGSVSGSGWAAGGLVGSNESGSVTACYSTALVTGDEQVGGLVGHNLNGAIAGCYSTGPVSGSRFTGGLVGYNYGGTVTYCYNTGGVNANDFVGGTVGYNDRGSVTECYSTGAVSGTSSVGGLVGSNYRGSIAASFWDTQTSGQTTSAGGTGKATPEMQTATTFLDAGWDFAGETTNGTEDIWWIDEGKDYPRLWWEEEAEPPP